MMRWFKNRRDDDDRPEAPERPEAAFEAMAFGSFDQLAAEGNEPTPELGMDLVEIPPSLLNAADTADNGNGDAEPPVEDTADNSGEHADRAEGFWGTEPDADAEEAEAAMPATELEPETSDPSDDRAGRIPAWAQTSDRHDEIDAAIKTHGIHEMPEADDEATLDAADGAADDGTDDERASTRDEEELAADDETAEPEDAPQMEDAFWADVGDERADAEDELEGAEAATAVQVEPDAEAADQEREAQEDEPEESDEIEAEPDPHDQHDGEDPELDQAATPASELEEDADDLSEDADDLDADEDVDEDENEGEAEGLEPDDGSETEAEPTLEADTEPGADEAPDEGIAADERHIISEDTSAPLQMSDKETQRLLKSLKKEQKRRAQQEKREAEELERRAKELAKRAKQRQKLRSDIVKHAERVSELAPELGFDPNRPITPIPAIEDPDVVQVEFNTIQEGRSYVRILFDQDRNKYLYEVIEPPLTSMETEVLQFIRDTLVRTLDGRHGQDEDEWEEMLLNEVERIIVDHSILVDEVSKQRLQYFLVRDFLGYGPIDVLMRDPMIEDISCDGPQIPVYIFHRQYESIKTNVQFEQEMRLDAFVIRLAQRCGKHISIAEPMLDATLPDTSRLQATLSREVTTRGSSFTIRRFRSDPLTPPDLVRLGTMSSEMAAFFWLGMQEGSSIIYAGGTASGKTTTLNAVSQFIPPEKKVVSIEDTREINLSHENWIAGLTRHGFGGENVGGKPAGSVDMYKLLEAALRQRPEYLLVGEVRGPEALTLFQAMATGHATYSTLHADSAMTAVYRLENPPINVPRLMLQTLDAVVIQVQARVNQRMVRRVKEVTEVVGIDPQSGDLLTNAVFRWDPSTDTQRYYGKSSIMEHIAEKNNLTMEEMETELQNRRLVIDWMVDKGIRHIDDVANVLSAYYANPEEILSRARGGSGTIPKPTARGHESGS